MNGRWWWGAALCAALCAAGCDDAADCARFGDTPACATEGAFAGTCVACDVDADCALVVAKCPYGCFVAVNVAEVDRIERRLDRAPSTCDYDCIEALGVFCDEGTCQVDYGE